MTDLQTAAPVATAPVAVAATPVVAPKFTPGTPALTGSPIHAIKPEGATSVIRMYESGTHGYIVIQQESVDMSNPVWPRIRKRSTLIKGTKEILTYIATHLIDKKTLAMAGKLIVEEVLYDDAFRAEVEAARDKATYKKGPLADYVQQLNLKADDEDTMLKDALKRAGKGDAPILTKNVDGEDVFILKFTRYMDKPNPATGQYDADISIQHDNYEEIAQYRADNPQDNKTE
jgi:hypothetical protein